MGYISLQFDKAKGSSDTRMSDHIERKTIPQNADSTRTHLNRELVELPDGVKDRNEAITHRIQSAGIKRKITLDQVRAIRIILSGTHEDMMKVQDSGRLSEWCNDNLQWLYKQFGRENTVSAVLHMDEMTPHIHATVVPIVTGERRKRKKEQEDGKRRYRKKDTTVRLCADDVLTREKMIAYHDSYAKSMEKYGLQRGVRGSEARHTTTAQYYRDLQRQNEELHSNVQQLQQQEKEAEKQLKQVKKEINTEKLEVVKTETKTAIIAKVGSLLGSGEIKELRQENKLLHEEVAIRDESIEKLQTMMQRQQKQHGRELTEVQAKYIKEQNEQKRSMETMQKWINRGCKWFPLFDDAFRMEKLCRSVGFTPEQTDQLFMFKPLEHSGNLYSEEHTRNISVTNAIAQIRIEQNEKGKHFALHINGKNILDWFKEQFEKIQQLIRPTIQPHRKGKGLKM